MLVVNIIFGATAALFIAIALSALWHLRWVRRLPQLNELLGAEEPQAPGRPMAQCSVVIAARDEQARIEATLRHLLAQTGIDLEIIVVDDRSTDGTARILRRLADEDSRVQAKRVDALPEGWLGKCHACHIGASAAKREWILFTDADCWLKPDVIRRAVLVAERDGADHVTMSPGTALHSLAARAWYVLFLTSLSN